MNISSEAATRLTTLLQQELSLTNRMLATLDLEQQALHTADQNALSTATADKQAYLVELNRASEQRQQLLSDAGLPGNRSGITQLLEAHGDNAAVELWQQLRAAAARCADQNRRIGLLIQRSRQITDQALHVLRHGDTGQPAAYGARGNATTAQSSRSLGRA